VVGNDPAVLIEFDFESQTVSAMDVPRKHS
jgi:hypothetical protein